MKIDWKRKLTSRKLWFALVTFVTMLIVYFTGDTEKAEKIAAIIMAGATCLTYIIAEGWTDGKHVYDEYEYVIEEDEEEKE